MSLCSVEYGAVPRMEDLMNMLANFLETWRVGENQSQVYSQEDQVDGVRDRHGDTFDMPQFAELMYQEYTFCSRVKTLDDWLCETRGIDGDNHVQSQHLCKVRNRPTLL